MALISSTPIFPRGGTSRGRVPEGWRKKDAYRSCCSVITRQQCGVFSWLVKFAEMLVVGMAQCGVFSRLVKFAELLVVGMAQLVERLTRD